MSENKVNAMDQPAEYVISERRERLDASKKKVSDLLLTALAQNSPPKRLCVSKEDWQTFTIGDAVGYAAGKLGARSCPISQ